jgi:hypothetical protein
MRGVYLVSQCEMFKVNRSRSRQLQDGSKISRRNTKSDRHVTKYINSEDNVTFEERVKATELF